MTTYKAIENPTPSKWVFPAGSDAFLVVDENGKAQNTTFRTLEQAQRRADTLNTPDDTYGYGSGFFDDDTAIDYFANSGETTPAEEEPVSVEEARETTLLVADSAYRTGEIMRDGKYHYRVTKDSWYVSSAEAADINDANDANAEPGWYTPVQFLQEAS